MVVIWVLGSVVVVTVFFEPHAASMRQVSNMIGVLFIPFSVFRLLFVVGAVIELAHQQFVLAIEFQRFLPLFHRLVGLSV